jgi:hypothetical protein
MQRALAGSTLVAGARDPSIHAAQPVQSVGRLRQADGWLQPPGARTEPAFGRLDGRDGKPQGECGHYPARSRAPIRWTRCEALVVVLVSVAAFLTIAGLYASGPTWKYGATRCLGGYEAPALGESHLRYVGPEICETTRHRTNAWERFTGSITGGQQAPPVVTGNR